jgi:hypothetical protein
MFHFCGRNSAEGCPLLSEGILEGDLTKEMTKGMK